MNNTIQHKHLLSDSAVELFNRINNKRISVTKLTNSELFDAMLLSDCGLIKFDRTPKGNPSKFLITAES